MCCKIQVCCNLFAVSNTGTLVVLVDDENQTKMYRNIVQGRWNRQDPNWLRLSPLLKDIISKLLLVDPGERVTARQSLEHPWIQGVCFPAHQKPGMMKKNFLSRLCRNSMKWCSMRIVNQSACATSENTSSNPCSVMRKLVKGMFCE